MQERLEKGTGRPVRHFAYCNGWYSAGVAQALRAEGFVSAVTTEDIKLTFQRALDEANPNRGSLDMIDPSQIQTPAADTADVEG